MQKRTGIVAAVAAVAILGAVALVRTTSPVEVEATAGVARPATQQATPAAGAPAATAVAPQQAAPSPASTPAAPAPRWSAAGALFDGAPDALGAHFCSASVVDSPRGDTLITAAHCVTDGDGTPPRTGMLFVPGYSDGVAPFGAWTVTAAAVDPRFVADADVEADVAFLTVSRPDSPPIEAVTGAFRLATDPGAVNNVEVYGLPDTDEAPTIRAGTTSQPSEHQLQLDALGLYDGVSGGPWVRDGDQVIGVTGGYEQGGSTPDVSYATYLGPDVAGLLARLD
ncbi:trypsin-like serine peptidase [Pseudonocardia sp. GCM10023141]|uniref:trypsin-like serine peptidase n=1 Tax=Pseudonocardia sp. GCM10023141 TaxID=3252653 RepID=UPI003621E075